MSVSDTEALVQTVRQAMNNPDWHEDGHVALDALAAELERVKGLLYAEQHGKHAEKWNELWAELEQEKKFHDVYRGMVDDLNVELEQARASIKTIIKEDGVVVSRQARKLDKALAALREVSDAWYGPGGRGLLKASMARARAAIAEIEGEA